MLEKLQFSELQNKAITVIGFPERIRHFYTYLANHKNQYNIRTQFTVYLDHTDSVKRNLFSTLSLFF